MQSKQNNQLHGNQKNVLRKKNDIKEQTNKKVYSGKNNMILQENFP